MSDVNTLIMTGNLTRTPEIGYTPSGVAIAEFGLASNRRYGKGDDAKEDVTFVEVTVFGNTAEAVAKNLQKGRKVLIEGRLRFHTWETEMGQKRSKMDVVAERVNFLPQGSKNGSGEGNDAGAHEEAVA